MFTGVVLLWADWYQGGCIKCEQLEHNLNVVSVSIKDIQTNFKGEYARLEIDQKVTFDLEKSKYGYKAVNVVRAEVIYL